MEQRRLNEDKIVRFQDDSIRSSLNLAREDGSEEKVTGSDIREEIQDAVNWFYKNLFTVAHESLEPITDPIYSFFTPNITQISIASGLSERQLKQVRDPIPQLDVRKVGLAPWAMRYIFISKTPAWHYFETILNTVHQTRKWNLGVRKRSSKPLFLRFTDDNRRQS